MKIRLFEVFCSGGGIAQIGLKFGREAYEKGIGTPYYNPENEQDVNAKTISIAADNGDNTVDSKIPEGSQKEPQTAKFEAVKGKRRKSGTGCVSKLGDNLYEDRYSPKGADGKRISRNVYAKTEEECERLLAEMIVVMKAEIKAEKEKLKAQQSA